jgi:glutaconate CoA-transferase subunit A
MKLLALDEAIDRFVPDGASVALGTALEALIPFAAGHALIRQRRRDLELIGPISDMLFDQLIGAGCVRRITAAWVGNVSAGLGHNYRRAVEQPDPTARLELEEHSNFSLGLGLLAAAMGFRTCPPARAGSDLAPRNAGCPRWRLLHVTRSTRRGDLARPARRRGRPRAFLGNLG